jgi:hypothetical protein
MNEYNAYSIIRTLVRKQQDFDSPRFVLRASDIDDLLADDTMSGNETIVAAAAAVRYREGW